MKAKDYLPILSYGAGFREKATIGIVGSILLSGVFLYATHLHRSQEATTSTVMLSAGKCECQNISAGGDPPEYRWGPSKEVCRRRYDKPCIPK